MNTTRLITILFTLLLPASLLAKGDITGTVLDAAEGGPLPYATVQLLDASGKPLAIGASTDEEGEFKLAAVPDGRYIVRITNIGSVMQERPVTVAGSGVSIGKVSISPDAALLKEVVVEGVKGQMRFELDRKVFNVDANIASTGASASELLESIPSVEVDQDGEVSLRGDSSVTIWINGKESGLTADNRAQILEQIPAETIQRIEVITNPSAKYSPEGTSGIINIILKNDKRGGYFGSAELSANTRGGANANFNINYNVGKWETYVGLGLRMRHSKSGMESDRRYTDGSFLTASQDGRNHGYNGFLRLGATYNFSASDNVYFSAFGMLGHRRTTSVTDFRSDIPGHWTSNINDSRGKGTNRGGHIELGYIHKWRDNHTLDVNLSFNPWGGPTDYTYIQHREFPSLPDEDIYQEQEMRIVSSSWEAKVDYTNQVLPWLKIEAGYNGEFGHENSPTETWQGTSKADMAFAPELYNRFIYDKYVNALYFTLGGKVRQFSFSAGLRGEQWTNKANSQSYAGSDLADNKFSKNSFALFPSVFLSYAFPYDNELQINYTRRIRRPWGGQLNTFVNISDPTNLSYGNPELQPMYTNAFELNYLKSWTYHLVSVSCYWRESSDLMERISFLDGNTMYTTWANVSSRRNLGAEIVVKNNFFKFWDLTTTVNLYDSRMKAWSMVCTKDGRDFPVSGDGQSDFSWDIRCMTSFKLPWGLSLQATGNYNSKRLTAQGSMDAGWSVDAGIRKTAGNWSFSVNCRDIFNSRKWAGTTIGSDYEQHSSRWRNGTNVRFTVKYSFGNMKAKRSRLNSGAVQEGGSSGYDEGME